jgi:hypothetical protein
MPTGTVGGLRSCGARRASVQGGVPQGRADGDGGSESGSGLRRVVATAETKHPRATQWLERLGFKPEIVDGLTVWAWEGGA